MATKDSLRVFFSLQGMSCFLGGKFWGRMFLWGVGKKDVVVELELVEFGGVEKPAFCPPPSCKLKGFVNATASIVEIKVQVGIAAKPRRFESLK